MKKLLLSFIVLFLASCASQSIELEATNDRTGQSLIIADADCAVTRIDKKTVDLGFIAQDKRITFRPGQREIYFHFEYSRDSQYTGLDTYESKEFVVRINFRKGGSYQIRTPKFNSVKSKDLKDFMAKLKTVDIKDERGNFYKAIAR